MAAPTFQAAGTGVGTAGANISVAWPTHEVGDVALLFVETIGDGTPFLSTPSGFRYLDERASGGNTGLMAFWCRATSASMPNVVIDNPDDHVYAVIITFRGVVGSMPVETSSGNIKGTASTSFSAASVTTKSANALIVNAVSRDNDSASAAFSGWTNANLVSITERFDSGTTDGNGGGIGIATGVKSAAGSTGTTTGTVTSSANVSISISLRSEGDKRYWVGGTGSWSTTTNWSLTSGGAGGAAIPTRYEDVVFNSNSFTTSGQTVTMTTSSRCFNMHWTGVTNNPEFVFGGGGGAYLEFEGTDMVFSPNMTITVGTYFALYLGLYGNSDTGEYYDTHITTGGTNLPLEINNYSPSLVLEDGLSLHIVPEDYVDDYYGGIENNFGLVTNGNTLSVGALTGASYSVYELEDSTINVFDGSISMHADATVEAENSTINLVNANLVGNGHTYGTVNFTGQCDVTGSNTIDTLSIEPGAEVAFTAGTTQSVETFNAKGTVADPITMVSLTPTSQFTLSKGSGTVRAYNLDLTDSLASGGATWYAYNSADTSNNDGWIFADATDYNVNDGGFITLW